MNKLVGVAAFLLVLYVAVLVADEGARSARNHYNLAERTGFLGLICVGVGILIVSGGIDLSIGSTVALSSTLMAKLCNDGMLAVPAMLLTLLTGVTIGLIHGLLVTKVRVQAFVVTLCGLFIYRGLARWLADDQEMSLTRDFPGFWREALYRTPLLGLPKALVILLVIAALAALFLHWSVHGRYLAALGNNERAVRYSGVRTDRYKVLAYVICSTLAAFYGVISLMKFNQVQPASDGNFLELYAIAGAVLGGCSLRGGEGTVVGMLMGAAILELLQNLVNMWDIPSALTYTVIGTALLLGAILDELLRRGQRRAV